MFAKSAWAAAPLIRFYPNGPSEEDAKFLCSQIEGTDKFEGRVFYVRIANDHEVADIFVNRPEEAVQISRELKKESEETVRLIMAGPAVAVLPRLTRK